MMKNNDHVHANLPKMKKMTSELITDRQHFLNKRFFASDWFFKWLLRYTEIFFRCITGCWCLAYYCDTHTKHKKKNPRAQKEHDTHAHADDAGYMGRTTLAQLQAIIISLRFLISTGFDSLDVGLELLAPCSSTRDACFRLKLSQKSRPQ